jgi:hypothetical protein
MSYRWECDRRETLGQALLQGLTTLSPAVASPANIPNIVRAAREEDLHTCQIDDHDHAPEDDPTQCSHMVACHDPGHRHFIR